VQRTHFREGGVLAGKHTYLRLRRERAVFDVCSAAFNKGWHFSVRAAELHRRLTTRQIAITILVLLVFAVSCSQHFGLPHPDRFIAPVPAARVHPQQPLVVRLRQNTG
jgi:hypothetical protein